MSKKTYTTPQIKAELIQTSSLCDLSNPNQQQQLHQTGGGSQMLNKHVGTDADGWQS